jgi:hypothetical protein
MPLITAIHFDRGGNMARVVSESEQIEAMCFERIGCRRLVAVKLTACVALWLDAEGADNGQSENVELTRFAASYGLDHPIYGEGIILGSDFEGDPTGLYEEEISQLTLTHAGNMLRELATAH